MKKTDQGAHSYANDYQSDSQIICAAIETISAAGSSFGFNVAASRTVDPAGNRCGDFAKSGAGVTRIVEETGTDSSPGAAGVPTSRQVRTAHLRQFPSRQQIR